MLGCAYFLLTSHTERLILCALLPSLLMVWKMSFNASGTSPGLSAVPYGIGAEAHGHHDMLSLSN
jgi:hypothetical protein